MNITTKFTALTDLKNVKVSRAVDPDPDANAFGNYNTVNQRGIVGPPAVPTSDFVGSLGAVSGQPLGLYYSGPIVHNTGIASSCCEVEDPDFYLAGGNVGDASTDDHGIGIGFGLGDLTAGQSVEWTYAYVMGGSLGTIDIPPPPPPPNGNVPAPASLALLGAALAGLRLIRRRHA